MKTDKIKPKKPVYKTEDGVFYKDRFMEYVFYPKELLETVGKNIDILLDSKAFQEANARKGPVIFDNKEALINIALYMVQPFLLENHRSIVEQGIQISSPNGKVIDLGYPNSIFVSINDPSGDIINIDPSGFFGFVYNCVNASLSLTSEVIRTVFFGSEPFDIDHFNKVCARLAGDITDNIVNVVFSVNTDGDFSSTFKQTFQASYDRMSWYTRDLSKAFNCSFKIEFINFRNFNKDFDESKVCRLFSISNKRKYLLMGCSIKIYLENTIYMGRIEDQKSKPE